MPIQRSAKKKKLSEKALSRGSAGGDISDLRPEYVEKLAPCMNACPQGMDIRGVINTINLHEKHGISLEEAFTRSWEILTSKNPLPAVCGRVCPHPCQEQCNREKKDGTVSINSIERFIGDWGLEQGLKLKKDEDAQPRSERIAVIGSGPAGLGCAYHLARRGYRVKVFEAFDKAGGMLRYGIPAYRMPREILDDEIQRILDLGVELETGVTVGGDIPYDKVKEDFDAIFVGLGAHKGRKMGIPGEDAENIYTGTGFLNMVNCGKPPEVGYKVIVVGGGDTAIDAARASRRLGADVTIVYRRTRNEMPAIEEEIVGAENEGIEFIFLATPIEVYANGDRATGIKCQRMELGEPDDSGRRRPVPIDEFFDMEVTCFIPSISQEPDFDGLENLKAGPKDWVKADEFMRVDDEKVFAGGDVLNLGLVTIALYQGRRAADTIHARFRGLPLEEEQKPPLLPEDKVLLDYFEKQVRKEIPELSTEVRLQEGDREIARTLTQEELVYEAARCMSCGYCFECGQCWSYCQDQAVKKPVKTGEKYTFKMELCKGCKKCEEVCPCWYIEMH